MTPEEITLPLKHFRASVVKSTSQTIERNGGRYGHGVIRNVSVITRGEALGHDMWVDADFLSDTVGAINAKDNGLKARFTHPGLSSDGLGKYLGKVHDAVMVGDKVLADLHFKESATKTPDGDLAAYVMQLAEDAPEDFGISIVFDNDEAQMEMHRLENTTNGRFVSPDENNKHNFPHARMSQLRAADVVDSPAANPEGLFHRNQEIAEEAELLLAYSLGLSDERPNLSCFDVDADRLSAAVQRFLSRHNLSLVEKGSEMPDNVKPDSPVVTQPTREEFAAELRRFTADFGAKGAEWFAEGKSYGDCQGLLIAELRSQLAAKDETIRSLQQRLAAVDLGENRPAKFAEAATEQPRERSGFNSRIRIMGKNYN
jgi:hypothetical protein